VPRWWTTRGLLFRARLLRIRGWRQWLPLMLLLFFIYVMFVYHFGQHGSDTNLTAFINSVTAPFSEPKEKTEQKQTGQAKESNGADKANADAKNANSASNNANEQPGNANDLNKHDGQASASSRLLTLLPLLAGVFTFIGAVWRGITAFGVKPASLLAGVSRGVSIRGLEAQTSFRQKFAVEFNDVTRALGKRSMLIFIDDLDRCRPENVLETLEAVNFLTTSGECFVIIGMAREYVQRCVGRAFKDVAEEMIDEVEEQSQANAATEDTAEAREEEAKEKRFEFARQYLDKLINIEVPVPEPQPTQSLALLKASTPKPAAPKTAWQNFRLELVRWLEQYWQVLPALIVLCGLLYAGYYLACALAQNAPDEQATQTLPTETPKPTTTPTTKPNPSATPVGAASASPTPTPVVTNERPELMPGGRGRFSSFVLPALALLIFIWAVVTLLIERPGLVVRDSPKFVAALEIWHPLVSARQESLRQDLLRQATPRTIKRFMNRVRYLAMRQRRQSDRPPPIKEFFARLAGVPAHQDAIESEQPDEKNRPETSKDRDQTVSEEVAVIERTQPESGADVSAHEQANKAEQPMPAIPDEALVALAAMQQFNPKLVNRKDYRISTDPKTGYLQRPSYVNDEEWQLNRKDYRVSTDRETGYLQRPSYVNDEEWQLLDEAHRKHMKEFKIKDFESVLEYRDRFLEMAASVQVH
jgi:KAP family P-loop domain